MSAMNSGFWRTRWSASPDRRIQRMFYFSIVLAAPAVPLYWSDFAKDRMRTILKNKRCREVLVGFAYLGVCEIGNVVKCRSDTAVQPYGGIGQRRRPQ